jgi:hypothetical protein
MLEVEAQAQSDSGRRTLAKAKIGVDIGILSSKLLALTSLCLYAQTSKWLFLGRDTRQGGAATDRQENKVITALHAAFVAMMREFDADLQRELGPVAHRIHRSDVVIRGPGAHPGTEQP